MKVGIVLSQPYGKSIGTDVRINGLLKGLSVLDVDLHVITPYAEIANLPKAKNISVHVIPSLSSSLHLMNLTYSITKRLNKDPFLFRKIICNKTLFTKNSCSLSAGIKKIIEKLGLDVIQAEQPVASIACINLKNEVDVPIISDFHGVWAEEMVASNLVSYDDKYYRTLFELEKEIAIGADVVSVVSEEMGDYIQKSFDIPSNKVALIPNATFPQLTSARTVDAPKKVLHSGTLHPWENVDLFINSMPYVLKKFPSAEFYLTRKADKLEKMMALSASLGVNPNFFWFSKGTEFSNFMRTCDVGVISSTGHIARKMAYPAKLYDYLSIGMPIVANDIGAWTNIIKKNKVGLVVDSSPSAYADGIVELLQNPDLINEYGQRGLDLVSKELNYYKTAEILFGLYQKLV